jgi:NADPH2:quinone reductase
MRALRIARFGPPHELAVAAVPDPAPVPGEVLIEVRAASVSPFDVKNAAGAIAATTLPRILGRDFAGLADGIAVWGTGGGGMSVTRDGSHAERLVRPRGAVRPKPANLSFEQAASVGVSYTAAWLALVRHANLQPGETVLIVGAAGSVGSAAIQIARWRGARVMGVDRNPSAELSAEEFIAAAQPGWDGAVRERTSGIGADVVFDMVGGERFELGLRALRHGGRATVISSPAQPRVSFNLIDFYHNELTLMGVDSLALSPEDGGDLLDELRPGFESGALTAPRVRTFPLEQARAAYAAVAQGTAGAKVVLVP